ncbi:MAG: glgX [Ilumatobacteraceae bacterium]|nr:glgX [Ilumatobacteraceae bacterium]
MLHETDALGATVGEGGTRFIVASRVAERIELCLFDGDGAETDRVDLAHDDRDGHDGTWCASVAGVGAGQRYGFRVHGPGNPAEGHACDPAKLLIDPAARRVTGELRWTKELVAPGVDSAGLVPRSVVVAPPTAPPPPVAGRRPWDQTVVYEAHVGHLTARHPLVAPEARGRYAGVAAPVVIDHLQRLGVTAVELLPVQHFVSEAGLVAAGRRNVWGYNPLAWGAPHAGYASAGASPVTELRASVAALHEAGIEVWLDVVFNHTCEGSLGSGPILSWRGFDNAAAYRLIEGPAGLVDDDVTGCGNAVDARSPAMRRLIRELLVRWVEEWGIDGFRFDLAATLIREDDGPTADAALLADLAGDERLAGTRLIAEPWDTGPGGYAVGAFPAPWREWNDRFRDDVRDVWRGEPGRWPALATRLTGSADLFRRPDEPGARPATTGINAVATHDGFTVADLVTYAAPVGGGHGQRSSNSGLEGPTADPAVAERRRRRQRALLGTVLCAQGVPMISSGDEIGRSQDGVADGYTLEPAEWGLPWPEADWDLAAWVAEAVALRRRHPALRSSGWVAPDDPQITWLTASGEVLADGAWTDPSERGLAVLLSSADDDDASVLVLAAPVDAVCFALPDGPWWVALDAADARSDRPAAEPVLGEIDVADGGFVVLVDRR